MKSQHASGISTRIKSKTSKARTRNSSQPRKKKPRSKSPWQDRSELPVRRAGPRLAGEAVGEGGVLVLGFVPLDVIVGWHGEGALAYPPWMSWMRWLSPQHFVTVFFALSGILLPSMC